MIPQEKHHFFLIDNYISTCQAKQPKPVYFTQFSAEKVLKILAGLIPSQVRFVGDFLLIFLCSVDRI